jgi:RNA 3'-terminal phosphate cyclase
VVPEDIGRAAAQLLLEEVSRGGVTDGTHQGLLLLMAALGPEEMNEVRLTAFFGCNSVCNATAYVTELVTEGLLWAYVCCCAAVGLEWCGCVLL